ncbi:HIRAN domain-containing protein [Nocardioides stalactiti]|uniref:HIRAN domain-containing protein n=1 Tax=Nocardioides stalactiti TaxID=2755356 RepID=UPI0015FF9D14|nr:HIRAN domain-containing protein [Nocardioides stalactiti]
MGWILGFIVLSLALFAVVARRVMDAPVAVGAGAPERPTSPEPPSDPASDHLLRKTEARIGAMVPRGSGPPPTPTPTPTPTPVVPPAAAPPEPEVAGPVRRTEVLTPEEEAEALAPGPDGFPDAWLEQVGDRLLVVTPRGPVNPRSRTAASRAGLWSFEVQVGPDHAEAAQRGDFSPGAPVRLVRDPDDADDPSVIAVQADGADELAGRVPRGYAKRLAKVLDSGADLVAVSTRGATAHQKGASPQVLAVERSLWDHLNRRASIDGNAEGAPGPSSP